MPKAVTINIRATDDFSEVFGALRAKIVHATNAMERFNTRQAEFSRRTKEVGKNIRQWGLDMKWYAVAVVGAGFAALKAASDYKKLQIQFDVLTGSAKLGKQLFTELRKFELEAGPFESDEIQTSAKALLNYGVAVKQIVPTLKNLGAIAAGAEIPLETVSRAYGRMVSEGHANTKSLIAFKKIGLTKMLAEMLTAKMGRKITQDDVTKGAKTIEFALVKQAMLRIETERYNGILAKIDDTTGETFGDTITLLNRVREQVGLAIEESFQFNGQLKGINTSLQEIIPKIGEFAKAHPGLIKLGVAAAAIFVAVVGLAIVIGTVVWAFGVIVGVTAGWWVLAAAVGLVYSNSSRLLKVWNSLVEAGRWIGNTAQVLAGAFGQQYYDGSTKTSTGHTLDRIDAANSKAPAAIKQSASLDIRLLGGGVTGSLHGAKKGEWVDYYSGPNMVRAR